MGGPATNTKDLFPLSQEVGSSSAMQHEVAEDFSKSELASYLSLPLAEAARQASMSCAAQIMESAEPSNNGVLQDGGTATNGTNVFPSQQNVRSSLAIQRERIANMGMNDVGCYLHLTLDKAAKELDMSTTALKSLCRKCGLAGWPSRQINALDKKIKNMESAVPTGNMKKEVPAKLTSLKKRREELYKKIQSCRA